MDGRPAAALLPRRDGTVLTALLDQLVALDVPGRRVVLCPEWTASAVRDQLDHRVEEVVACRTVREELDVVAKSAAEGTGEVIVVDGGIVAHNEALAKLLLEPRMGTGLLIGERSAGPGVRTADGIVVSAASRVHTVTEPDGDGLGVLRVSLTDTGTLAEVARSVSAIGRVPDTADGLVELLTVGMVRSGVRVAAVPVQPYVLHRPRTELEVGAALVDLSEIDEERLRLASSDRPGDGPYARLVVRRISKHVTRLALRYGLRPNVITAISLGIAFGGAALFLLGNRLGWVLGAILLQVAFLADSVAGEVARYTRTFSPVRTWLDGITDRSKEYAVYAALAAGAARIGSSIWMLAGATLALQAFRQSADFGFGVRQAERRADHLTEPVELPINRRDDASDVRFAANLAPTGPAHHARARGVGAVLNGMGGTGASLGRRAVRLSEATSRISVLAWLKRLIIFPIGERWLVISVVAAFFQPRMVFGALLSWGGLAVVYTVTGKVLRSMANV
ncbi:MAG TPA: CDP-alcohol phosphatidyltransferase family protein [Actinomycetes bacterium]|nr:CDP-alcohol phosphatidyltransferase family protein [Actinomycetes bacterium]